MARHIGEAKRKRKSASGSRPESAAPDRRRRGGAPGGGAYWQTSGLKKQAGSGAIDHIGAPAGIVFGEGDFALPPADRGAPGAFPFPARPAARSLLSCTAGGGGRRFSCEPLRSVEARRNARRKRAAPRREAGRPCRRPSRRPFSVGPEPFGTARIPVVMLSRAPLMAGSWGLGAPAQIPIASVKANVFELLERPFGRPVFALRVARASGTRPCP